MPTTTWDNEVYPGTSVDYDEPSMTYDDNTDFEESGTPRYDTVGEATSWTLEDK